AALAYHGLNCPPRIHTLLRHSRLPGTAGSPTATFGSRRTGRRPGIRAARHGGLHPGADGPGRTGLYARQAAVCRLPAGLRLPRPPAWAATGPAGTATQTRRARAPLRHAAAAWSRACAAGEAARKRFVGRLMEPAPL